MPIDSERVKTGIPGLDGLLEGGLIRGSTNLIAGASGTCKTILGCQFLWNGLQLGENGVYVALEENSTDILKNMQKFGWNFENLIKTKKFNIVDITPSAVSELTTAIINQIRSTNAQRFVLDSLTVAAMGWKESPAEFFKFRIKVFDLLRSLKQLGVTSLLISEIPQGSDEISRFGFEEFLTDGIIHLYNMRKENIRFRGMEILKLRGSKHSNRIVPISIRTNGVTVHPESEFFEEIK